MKIKSSRLSFQKWTLRQNTQRFDTDLFMLSRMRSCKMQKKTAFKAQMCTKCYLFAPASVSSLFSRGDHSRKIKASTFLPFSDIHHAKLIRLIQTCNNSIAKSSLTHLISCIGFERFIITTQKTENSIFFPLRSERVSATVTTVCIIHRIYIDKEEKPLTHDANLKIKSSIFLENCVK